MNSVRVRHTMHIAYILNYIKTASFITENLLKPNPEFVNPSYSEYFRILINNTCTFVLELVNS